MTWILFFRLILAVYDQSGDGTRNPSCAGEYEGQQHGAASLVEYGERWKNQA